MLWCASIRWSQPPWPDHLDSKQFINSKAKLDCTSEHTSLVTCLIPMLMTQRISVIISRVSANIWILLPVEIRLLTRWISYISGTSSGPSANCRRIKITVRLPSDGWKFGPAMKGNPSDDNELAVGFPRPLHQLRTWSYLF